MRVGHPWRVVALRWRHKPHDTLQHTRKRRTHSLPLHLGLLRAALTRRSHSQGEPHSRAESHVATTCPPTIPMRTHARASSSKSLTRGAQRATPTQSRPQVGCQRLQSAARTAAGARRPPHSLTRDAAMWHVCDTTRQLSCGCGCGCGCVCHPTLKS
jgi:hypothetical protein